MTSRWWFYPALIAVSLMLVAAGVGALTVVLLWPNLPSLEVLTDYRPKMPLRIYSAEGELIGEFGEEKRAVVKIQDVPQVMKAAILAAEDDRFYQHGGVDYAGVVRAALANLQGKRLQGASTITMQVARTFFLTRDKTLARKLSEVLLSFKIEANLSKDQILELYINQIFLGQRAYGFASAANVYFGKSLADLTPAEAALLAGLPQAPSTQNPFANPKKAKARQEYVLRRMREVGWLSEDQYKKALADPLRLNPNPRESFALKAEYVAEMARAAIYEQYGEPAYVSGLRVYTTISRKHQDAATEGLRAGLVEYDHRHGYRGPEAYVSLPADADDVEDAVEEALQDREPVNELIPAVVLEASPREVKAMLRRGDEVRVTGDGLKFAGRAIGEKNPDRAIRRGAVIRLQPEKNGYSIGQVPKAEAALVSLDPSNGAILSLAGGFDFGATKFNHVTQAWRQPGSSFKPFIYSAALEKGFTPATVLNDAPFVIEAAKTGGQLWEPKNYDGKYEGPMRLRTAIAKSKNMVSIRLLQAIGPHYAQDYIQRFGFDPKMHPAYLTMALGAGSATPLQMASAYAIFANGGYRVKPWFISRVENDRSEILYQARPEVAGVDAERVLDERNAFIMTTLMRDVVRYGTAARASALGRQDLAGKTGTTNDHVDAWFCGFNGSLVAVSWVGFDTPANLGNNETGGVTALPAWMVYAGRVLKGVPETELSPPSGIVAVNINPLTGLREPDGHSRTMEYFYSESQPPIGDDNAWARDSSRPPEEVRNQIF